ncbi:hypothetical protein CMU66_13950 [Elizabethkingia anophelis]|nr:hypothetical protein [Elizabethkingia anophelis]MDV3564930.1 hypothetical protein [Elizabethkingia anophelis]MDV3623437.1 hypothetical protein [Elizabethkingia anophelis]MDV3643303.1 hypothetical protein [Elizabethkingia anophelis]MDV3657926.1 hypothetical protein [Elizabethkingia anophelis]
MSFQLSNEQIDYINSSGKVVLNACPGSGKTTAIAHKIDTLIKGGEFQDISPRILCLSFTNVAKDEIAEKFREIHGFSLVAPHTISTIDSFINTYITLPFAHKIRDIGKRYRIIDDMGVLNKICLENISLSKNYGALMHRFSPSEIDFTLDGGICWKGKDKSNMEGFVDYGKAIKQFQFKIGLLKTSDSAFMAYHILKKIPRISKYLSSKFSHLIIDEAQDTSEIQHSILELLYKGGINNIDLVGDPYQCLYQWRNASPDLFLQKFEDTKNWRGINLTENRRSTKNIIDIFSLLRRPIDEKIVAINDNATDFPLHIIKYDSSNYSDAINRYETICNEKRMSSYSILVRGNTLKNSLLGKENDYLPWDKTSIAYKIVVSKILFLSNEVKEAVKMFRRIIIKLKYPNTSYEDSKNIEDDLKINIGYNALIFELIRDLPSFDCSVKDWTEQTQVYFKTKLDLVNSPDFKIRKNNVSKGNHPFDKSTLSHPMNKYFKKSVTMNNSMVATIHQVKGMTFDSIFLILSDNSTGQNISLKDFDLKKKHTMPSEKQRLIYVALSRPKHLLCIGVPKDVSETDLNKIFINNFALI